MLMKYHALEELCITSIYSMPTMWQAQISDVYISSLDHLNNNVGKILLFSH